MPGGLAEPSRDRQGSRDCTFRFFWPRPSGRRLSPIPIRIVTEQPSLGIIEVLGSGAGFIRRRDAGYTPSNDDVYVGPKLIQRLGLRTGDEIHGVVGGRPRNGKAPPVSEITQVNGQPAAALHHRPTFNRLSAQHPDQQLKLECNVLYRGQPDYTNRVVDLFCPFGKGQRAMIVSPAKSGKTTVLQRVAEGIVRNHPDITLLVLLVDERPEEITEMEMAGFGEVISSSFDYPAERHVSVAEITLERARRMVEMGQDVVIILDSITRLARAYNTVEEGSGRTLSGGLDANSLEKPKRFLGSARKVDPAQGGGSLTIVATALVDTGSRMDQVIFEEFKGTGNSEIVLDRKVADKRVFPSMDILKSGTRKEELLVDKGDLQKTFVLRRILNPMGTTDAIEFLISKLKQTKSNSEFFDSMNT